MGDQVFSSFKPCSFWWRSIKLLMLQVKPFVSSGVTNNYNHHVTYTVLKDAILFFIISFVVPITHLQATVAVRMSPTLQRLNLRFYL